MQVSSHSSLYWCLILSLSLPSDGIVNFHQLVTGTSEGYPEGSCRIPSNPFTTFQPVSSDWQLVQLTKLQRDRFENNTGLKYIK